MVEAYQEEIVGKSEFARRVAVSPARVSQWLQDKDFAKAVLVGEGRSAKIRLELASALIKEKQDPTQMLANGRADLTSSEVELPFAGSSKPSGSNTTLPPSSSIDRELKEEKLERERRSNRIAARAEAEREGALVPALELRKQVTKAVSRTVQMFEAGVPEIASALASQFGIPSRDVEHALRKSMNEVRAHEAKKETDRAQLLPDTQDVILSEPDTQ